MHLLASPHVLVLGCTGVQNAGKKLATQRITMSSTSSTPKHGANGALLTQDRKTSRGCIHGIPCKTYSMHILLRHVGIPCPRSSYHVSAALSRPSHHTCHCRVLSAIPFAFLYKGLPPPSHSCAQLSPSLRAVLVRRPKISKPLGSYLPAADITSPFFK